MSSIGPVVSEEKMFENVDGRRTDDRRTTDAGVTGILLAHQWAFGSGELIKTIIIIIISTNSNFVEIPYQTSTTQISKKIKLKPSRMDTQEGNKWNLASMSLEGFQRGCHLKTLQDDNERHSPGYTISLQLRWP